MRGDGNQAIVFHDEILASGTRSVMMGCSTPDDNAGKFQEAIQRRYRWSTWPSQATSWTDINRASLFQCFGSPVRLALSCDATRPLDFTAGPTTNTICPNTTTFEWQQGKLRPARSWQSTRFESGTTKEEWRPLAVPLKRATDQAFFGRLPALLPLPRALACPCWIEVTPFLQHFV